MAVFADAIAVSKASKFGAAVYVYPVEEYQQMRLFLTADGTSGVAAKPDGDIVSVFSSLGTNAGHALMSLAVTVGSTKLDAFESILPAFCSDHGFRVVSRLGWDDSQAPAGWDKQSLPSSTAASRCACPARAAITNAATLATAAEIWNVRRQL